MNKAQLVYEMLTESTGIAIMDSGGGENRHWQRNQKRTLAEFEADPQVELEQPTEKMTSKELEYTISVFHYLVDTDRIGLDEICERYNALKCPDWESDIYGVSKSQAKWLNKHGFEIGEAFNTYNGESSLSQVLQGTYLKLGVESYVLLQIHNGCDVRGGYTDAKLFCLPDDWMPCEDVYGTITRRNGEQVQIENSYDGYSLTDEEGEGVELESGDQVELGL